MGVVKKKLVGSIWVACASQGVVTLGEVLGAFDAGGHALLDEVLLGVPVLQPLREGAFLACLLNSSCSTCIRCRRKPWL
jgi:hypothetical protein